MAENKFAESAKWFAGQPKQLRSSILTLLAESKPEISIQILSSQVAEKTGADKYALEKLFERISLLVPLATGDPEFTTFVVNFLLQSGVGDSATANTHPELAAEFADLLSRESSLGLTGKAQNIIWGHGQVFRDAHVATQIRPIFLADLRARAENAVVIHELRVDFRRGEQNDSFCLILDAEKLRSLKAVVERCY